MQKLYARTDLIKTTASFRFFKIISMKEYTCIERIKTSHSEIDMINISTSYLTANY